MTNKNIKVTVVNINNVTDSMLQDHVLTILSNNIEIIHSSYQDINIILFEKKEDNIEQILTNLKLRNQSMTVLDICNIAGIEIVCGLILKKYDSLQLQVAKINHTMNEIIQDEDNFNYYQ